MPNEWLDSVLESSLKLGIEISERTLDKISENFSRQTSVISSFLVALSFGDNADTREIEETKFEVFEAIFQQIFKDTLEILGKDEEEFYHFQKTVDKGTPTNYYIEYPEVINSIKQSIEKLLSLSFTSKSPLDKNFYRKTGWSITSAVIAEDRFMGELFAFYNYLENPEKFRKVV